MSAAGIHAVSGIIPGLVLVGLCLGDLPQAQAQSESAAPWHQALSQGGIGYWHSRVSVTVSDDGGAEQPVEGVPVQLTVGPAPGQVPLNGFSRAGLRVCDDKGLEFLYAVQRGGAADGGGDDGAGTAAADAGNEGGGDASASVPDDVLRIGDQISFYVYGVQPGISKTYSLYANNPYAQAVDEFLPFFTNGGFEDGAYQPNEYRPVSWSPGARTANHTAEYRLSGGRGGARCVYHRVTPGAAWEWVSWAQRGIPVAPGRTYEVRGWLKAQDVVGCGNDCGAGWFIHLVNDQGGWDLNEVHFAGPGTYDWREVVFQFTAQARSRTVDLGTALWGTGEAWFDDLSLTEVAAPPSTVQVVVGPLEQRDLDPYLGNGAWQPLQAGDWRVRAEIRAFDFDPATDPDGPLPIHPPTSKLVVADVRRAVHKIRRQAGGVQPPYRVHVVDAYRQRVLTHVWLDGAGDLVFQADMQPSGEHRYFVYFAPQRELATRDPAYDGLVQGPLNRVRAGDFEDPAAVEAYWPAAPQGSEWYHHTLTESGGVVGPRCIQLDIDPQAPTGDECVWAGRHQYAIPAKPNTPYLYAGYLKTGNVTQGGVSLYCHFKNAAGQTVGMTGTGGSMSGTQDWKLQTGLVTTPGDGTSIDLHLTMCAHGTVWHDGILLAEASTGLLGEVGSAPGGAGQDGLSVWAVNPLVKVFPDDPPGSLVQRASFAAARNEREPYQLVIRSPVSLQQVSVEVSALEHPSGYALPPLEVFRVGTVPVDYPSGYYACWDKAGSPPCAWLRKLPREHGWSDGWAGDWPDPLIPLNAPQQPPTFFDLPAETTQALWLRVSVPSDAPPGLYSGTVWIQSAGNLLASVPLNFTVWNFTLPTNTHLPVIYDANPGWNTVNPDPSALRDLYRFMSEYRVAPGSFVPEPKFTLVNGQVQMDAADYEAMAGYCFDELHLPVAYSPFAFFVFNWALPPRCLLGCCPLEDGCYESVFTQAYGQFFDRMRTRGWADKFVHYAGDEPFLWEDEVSGLVNYVVDLAKAAAPDVPVYSSVWSPYPVIEGHLNHWGIGHYGIFPVSEMQRRLEAGDLLWFTTDGQIVIDTPYLAVERLWPTYCFKYDVSGYEYWGLSFWTYNPWQRGWHQWGAMNQDGEHPGYVRYPNGDGYLAYPGEPIGVSGHLPSIRLEAVRDGIEDYEYYYLLRKLISQRPPGAPAAPGGALDEVRNLVTIPNAGGMRPTETLPDPDAVYRARQKVAHEIMGLLGAPIGRVNSNRQAAGNPDAAFEN